MININRFLKQEAEQVLDTHRIKALRRAEIKKFENEKRASIYQDVILSEEQIKSIDDVYMGNYGEKIPYTWHRHYTAFTGRFDKFYFPELLFIPEFERFMNLNPAHTQAFEDKNTLHLLADSAGIRMPQTIFSEIDGLIQDRNKKIVSMDEVAGIEGEYFVKPTVGTSSGIGCQVVSVKDGIDQLTGSSIEEILKKKGANWTIQERIKCHNSISNIYPSSVNTFRIMTYIWKDRICHVPVVMRIGQGGANVDNAHAGGMFIALDDDGVFHDKAFTEFKQEYKEHPDTKVVYHGYRIDLFPNVLKAAIKAHSYLSQLGCINWDFTMDENGDPVLIEANIRGSGIWLFEMAHGCGPFGELTPEILRWIRIMKNTKYSERSRFSYGMNFE